MESTEISIFLSEEAVNFLKKFFKAKNKIKAVVYLKEFLLMLKNEKGEDPQTAKFLDIVQKEFNFELGKTNWKKIQIDCPEIGYYDKINRCLFQEEKLKATQIYDPNSSLMSTWDYLNKNVTFKYRKCKQMYKQMKTA